MVKGADITGTVREISLRLTRVVTADNVHVYIPNSLIATNSVLNYSKENERRVELIVAIMHKSDVTNATSAIKEGLKQCRGAVIEKATEVLVDSFTDISVNLKVRVWMDMRKTNGFTSAKDVATQCVLNALSNKKIKTST